MAHSGTVYQLLQMTAKGRIQVNAEWHPQLQGYRLSVHILYGGHEYGLDRVYGATELQAISLPTHREWKSCSMIGELAMCKEMPEGFIEGVFAERLLAVLKDALECIGECFRGRAA